MKSELRCFCLVARSLFVWFFRLSAEKRINRKFFFLYLEHHPRAITYYFPPVYSSFFASSLFSSRLGAGCAVYHRPHTPITTLFQYLPRNSTLTCHMYRFSMLNSANVSKPRCPLSNHRLMSSQPLRIRKRGPKLFPSASSAWVAAWVLKKGSKGVCDL